MAGYKTGKPSRKETGNQKAHKGIGKDPDASKEHHAANAENGLGDGVHGDGDCENCEEGGEGMAGNCTYS